MTLSLLLVAAAADGTRGVAIALAGIVIVGVALSLISLFIAALPRLLTRIAKVWPEVEHSNARDVHPESMVPDDDAVLAAIGYVLHCEFQKQLQPERAGMKPN